MAAFVAGAVTGAGPLASASWSDGAPASHQIATATLEPPASPALARGLCVAAVGDALVVSWAASASEKADGYEVLRAVGSGGYSVHALVAGRTTTSFTDPALAFSTQYRYKVRTTKLAWRSAETSEVAMTTRSALCA